MEEIKTDIEPQLGYAIVRKQIQGESAGGVVIPGTVDMARYHVIAASEGYMEHGHLIRSNLQPGDEAVMAPNGVREVMRSPGKVTKVPAVRLVSCPHLPDDQFIVLLADVALRIPREKVKALIGGTPKVQVAPASAIALVKH